MSGPERGECVMEGGREREFSREGGVCEGGREGEGGRRKGE